MRPNTWTIYEPIDDVALSETTLTNLRIASKIDGEDLSAPIHIDVRGPFGLTLEQSAELRARLLAAENDVRSAAPSPVLTATGTEGRCEHCSAEVQAGERVIVEDEGTEDRVVLHAECPAAPGRN